MGQRPKPNDSRCTPTWLLDVIYQFDSIALDPSSNPHSQVVATVSIMLPDDGLAVDWSAFTLFGGIVFCNPPWSYIHPWADKASSHWVNDACETLMLTRTESATEWGRTLFEESSAICHLKNRVAYPIDGEPNTTDTRPSMLTYFGDRLGRFERIFSAVGYVQHAYGQRAS